MRVLTNYSEIHLNLGQHFPTRTRSLGGGQNFQRLGRVPTRKVSEFWTKTLIILAKSKSTNAMKRVKFKGGGQPGLQHGGDTSP